MMLNHFKSFFTKPGEGVPSPGDLKRQKLIMYAVVLAGGSIVGYLVMGGKPSLAKTDNSSNVPKIATAADVLDEKAIWVNRLEKQATNAAKSAQIATDQNKILTQKVDVLEAIIKKTDRINQMEMPEGGGGEMALQSPLGPGNAQNPLNQSALHPPVGQPMPGKLMRNGTISGMQADYQDLPPAYPGEAAEPTSKILHLSLPDSPLARPKTVDDYIPANTRVRGVITMGVVVSTGTSAQGDPQPIAVRFVNKGDIPRGFKADLKDVELHGSCIGDISSERAKCILQKMTITERNGEIMEKRIEGWLVGEDGMAGLRGHVVDKAGPQVREAFITGMLGGIAGYFKQQAQSSVFPISPFGQTNALSDGSLAKASVANGTGNALEKMADFSIKRAEQMSPVIVISSGRMIDVLFKEGVDISDTAVKQELQIIGQDKRQTQAQEEALNSNIQIK